MENFNPWWRTGKVPQNLIGKKRKAFDIIQPYLSERQILILYGLRRVGKTTLLFQIINLLLQNEERYKILYYSFDEGEKSIDKVVKEYQEKILKTDISENKRIYFLFDEIQKVENWQNTIKILYDRFPNSKIIISGSATLSIQKGMKESLAGRFFEFLIEPLDFEEYLQFENIKIDFTREQVFELELKTAFNDYLKNGGYIEALDFDEQKRIKYFKEGLLERVIYKDLLESFRVRYVELLYRLIGICAEKPGMYLDYKSVGNDLNHDQRTIAEYYSYLNYALLVSKLYNFSPSLITSEKKIKKVYLSNTAFTVALNPSVNESLLIEQYFVNLFKTKYFWRSPQKDEVDIILKLDKALVPVEIKFANTVKRKDASSLFKFLNRYNLERGILISKQTETVFEDGEKTIKVIPYWKHKTLQKDIGIEANPSKH